jgi:hypothetical protein
MCPCCCLPAGAAVTATSLNHPRRLLAIRLSQTNPQQSNLGNGRILSTAHAAADSRATDGASTTLAVNSKVSQALGSTFTGASSRSRLTTIQTTNPAAAIAAGAAHATSVPAGGDTRTVNSKVVAALGQSWGPKTRVARMTAQAAVPAAAASVVAVRPVRTVPWKKPTDAAN